MSSNGPGIAIAVGIAALFVIVALLVGVEVVPALALGVAGALVGALLSVLGNR